MYKHGQRAALIKLGLASLEDIDPVQASAVGAAGLAPFAGMIGEKPIIHDPVSGAKGQRFRTMKELAQAAQGGDVLITGKPTGSFWKTFMSPLTGSEFYHAQPVVGRRKGMGTTLTAGEYSDPSWGEYKAKDILDEVNDIPAAFKGDYSDAVLLRPKTPLTKSQIKALNKENVLRGKRRYDSGTAVKSWLNDLFVPKIPGLEHVQTICEGNVCSTQPSQTYKNVLDLDVVPGKPAKNVMPADFLRSDQFELVGSRIPTQYNTGLWSQKLRPLAVRAGIGTGLAGATYGITEHPEGAAIPAGAAAGFMAGKHHTPAKDREGSLLLDTFDALTDPKAKQRMKKLKFYGKNRLLPMAAGAGLAYGGLRTGQEVNEELNEG